MAAAEVLNGESVKIKGDEAENVDTGKAHGLSSSPAKKGLEKKRRGGRPSRRKEKAAPAVLAENVNSNSSVATEDDDATLSKSNFDCSSAIAQICEGLWVSAVSGTRMGTSLESTLLDQSVTGVVSTLGSDKGMSKSETFEHHAVDTATEDCLRALHDACDFIHEAVSDGGVVFIHSRAGFARSDWAVFLVLGYMMKYQNVKLQESIDSLSETTKHTISPATKFRKDLATFEEDALGDASVSEDWVAGSDDGANGSKNHSLSRRKLAENLNDRRLLKKKSPHK